MSKDEKISNILHSAIQIFSTNGFDRAKIEHISSHAGIGKSTIYEYFSSKEELFIKCVDFIINKYKQDLRGIVSKEMGLQEKMIEFIELNQKLSQKTSSGTRIIMSQSAHIISGAYTLINNAEQEIYRLLYNEILSAVDRGEIRGDIDPNAIVVNIQGMVMQMYPCFIGVVIGREVDCRDLINILFNGIKL